MNNTSTVFIFKNKHLKSPSGVNPAFNVVYKYMWCF